MLALENSFNAGQFDATVFLNILSWTSYIGMLFIFCYFGEKLSIQSSVVGNIIFDDVLWYKLPISHQKLALIIINRSKKSFQLRGYDIFDCSLPIFVNVCISYSFNLHNFYIVFMKIFAIFQILRTSVSYFLIMRKLKNGKLSS